MNHWLEKLIALICFTLLMMAVTGCANLSFPRDRGVEETPPGGALQPSIRSQKKVSLADHADRAELDADAQFTAAMQQVRVHMELLRSPAMQWQAALDPASLQTDNQAFRKQSSEAATILTARIETSIELIRELENARDAWLVMPLSAGRAVVDPGLPAELNAIQQDMQTHIQELQRLLDTDRNLAVLAGPTRYHQQLSELLATAQARQLPPTVVDDWLDQAGAVARMRLASDEYQLYALASLANIRHQQLTGTAGLLSADDRATLDSLRAEADSSRKAAEVQASLLQILQSPAISYVD